jgi:hypothetical protein
MKLAQMEEKKSARKQGILVCNALPYVKSLVSTTTEG